MLKSVKYNFMYDLDFNVRYKIINILKDENFNGKICIRRVLEEYEKNIYLEYVYM